jgi:nucleoid DNA-binding protein
MNKQDIVTKIAKDTGLTKAAATGALDCLIETVTKALKKGDTVSFVGFGTFKISNRKARKARNPQTGATINIPKRRVPRFSAGKALKQAVR